MTENNSSDNDLSIGEKVFCADCGRSFEATHKVCPHCNSKNLMKKSILWCDKE